MFWIKKLIFSKHKVFLIKKIIKLKSFRFVRELYYSIKHPEEKDLMRLVNERQSTNSKIVFVDIGAFEGDFAWRMFKIYPFAKAYLIEPVPKFMENLKSRLNKFEIYTIQKALTATGETVSLSDQGESSSSLTGDQTQIFESMSIRELLNEITEERIDLFQLNCEGGEYKILPELISSGEIWRISALNIQFHYLNVRNIYYRHQIVKKLNETHKKIWNVPFIWERWELRNKP